MNMPLGRANPASGHRSVPLEDGVLSSGRVHLRNGV